jgi:hypothetical protein
MSVRFPLESLRRLRFFASWDDFVDSERVAASEASVQALLVDLLAQTGRIAESVARAAVGRCVVRFNGLDDGWICTIEREDICEAIGRVVAACGFEWDDDWLQGREW